MGAIRSLVISIMVLGTALPPAILGVLYDTDVRIETSFLWFTAYMILVSLLQIPLALKAPKKDL